MPESEMPQQAWYRRLIFIFIFIATNILAFITLPLLVTPQTQVIRNSTGNSLLLPIYYIVSIVAFTAFFIYLSRKRKIGILKGLVAILLGYSVFVLLLLDLSFLYFLVDLIISAVAAFLLIYYSFRRARSAIYLLGIIMGAGVSAVLASIISIEITIVIIAVFSIYDSLSVNISKSMIEVAETALDSGLPLLFTAGDKENPIAMGFGDTVLPTFALISIYLTFNLEAFLISLIVTLVSFGPMMYFASKRPQPGLPYLINAVFIGLVIYLLIGHI
ncbi:MAG: presenilin family intramembrane aspartyl protease [Candidatus Thermoplasmatota archaeon]|jgi:presenilin-like A22 family membrane protease|nr:presenilin family intramembrane aspartyl protease [Candidatus Thermoplasmatota archaeon]